MQAAAILKAAASNNASAAPAVRPKAIPVPNCIVRVLNGKLGQVWRFAFYFGGIESNQLTEKDLHRPAIGDDVVQGHQQHMVAIVQPQQTDTQQRTLFQIERPLSLERGQPHRLTFTFGLAAPWTKVTLRKDSARER